MFKRKPVLPEPQFLPDSVQSHLPPPHDDSNWLVSYADMMTLLCGFFIMLFSMCKLDTPQYDSFKEALSKQFGGEYVSTTKELARYATQVLQELGLEKTVTLKTDAYGIALVFESTVFFNTLSADVSPEGRRILEKIITRLGERQLATGKLYRIVVEGHTDNRPIVGGVYPSNWELSGARAARVIRMFLATGFEPDHLTAIGYADTRPLTEARGSTGKWDETALAQNRRVVIRVMEPSVDSVPISEKGGTVEAPAALEKKNQPLGDKQSQAAPQALPQASAPAVSTR
ncbi:MAG: flagellar motor protein MotB [Bdellovibrio sp.]|nr:flagellar motor protein MotB [Bdellovibrio sp.]